MVETPTARDLNGSPVLIYPYWNVKTMDGLVINSKFWF